MADKPINWTANQHAAIHSAGGDVVVTASAGTGKTAVLSERCARIVGDAQLCPDISSVLVLTFTEAAAEQMRARIAQCIRRRLDEEPTAHLRNVLTQLDAADISTIHSFCKRMISKYFYVLGVDPAFRIIDTDEQKFIKSEVLSNIISTAWLDANLRDGMNILFRRRNINPGAGNFLNNIIEISEFLTGIVSRDDWFERAADLNDSAGSLANDLANRQKQILHEKLGLCESQLRCAMALDENLCQGHWSSQIENYFLAPVVDCLKFLDSDDMENCAAIITAYVKSKWKNKPKGLDDEIKDLVKTPADRAMKLFAELADFAIINPDYERIVAPMASFETKVLIELVKRFDRRYAEVKRSLNCLDFADLEHQMLRLLNDSESFTELSPSKVALELRRRFKYIFVDEYQDINATQQAILDLLNGDGNIFVVGDIKQSIYAWRQADPTIFLERLKKDSDEENVRLDLNDNFRSRKGVLDFVNTVFERIMKSGIASIDYDDRAQLKAAAEYEPADSSAVEIHLLDNDRPDVDDDDENDGSDPVFAGINPAAVMVANRIEQMVDPAEGLEIYDAQAGNYRRIRYGDIVILMRSLAGKANDYVQALRLAGIAVNSASSSGYFATTEITDCLSLLKVLDNPHRDIEFAAVLRSPFFNVTDSELAKIRMHGENKKRNYYDSVLQYAVSGADEGLRNRLANILESLDEWRTLGRCGSLADLIWRIYRQSRYLSFVSALAGSKQRRANLLKLHQRAVQFEGFASSRTTISLGRFVEFVEKLLESGGDWAPAEPDNSADNAVRIMSVHKSKGLEFPVVFCVELQSSFNMRDVHGDCINDAANTLGLKIIDPDSGISLKSLAHEVISAEKTKLTRAEEMRILYVAMTRARERLILFGSAPKSECKKIILQQSALKTQRFPADWQIIQSRSFLKWILYALADDNSLVDAFCSEQTTLQNEPRLFDLYLHGQDQINWDILKPAAAGAVSDDKIAEILLEKADSALSWQYPFAGSGQLPTKLSVSAITHRQDEFSSSHLIHNFDFPSKPQDASLEIGTATHLIIQKLNLQKPVTIEAIETVKTSLVSAGSFGAELAVKVDSSAILGFFQSELGKMSCLAENTVLREWPFTFALPASELDALFVGQSCDEKIIVQGIIDMIIKTNEHLIVIDFKTDRVDERAARLRAGQYEKQIKLYAAAAGAILGQKVTAGWIHFLHCNSPVQTV